MKLLHSPYSFTIVSTPHTKAPAKSLAEHGDALQLELQTEASSLHHSTRSVLKGTLKNASRQYQRALGRFGMAMTLIQASVAVFTFLLVQEILVIDFTSYI